MLESCGDFCVGFFDKTWNDGAFSFPDGASVLEIGSYDADWLSAMATVRPDLQLTGIDARHSDDARVIQGNVITADFQSASFDAVVAISAIEHIGLGAYGDPVDENGDIKTMEHIARWLKPGGWCYFDVPYGDRYFNEGNYRRYDEQHLAERLLKPFPKVRYQQLHTAAHPDSPYMACVVAV